MQQGDLWPPPANRFIIHVIVVMSSFIVRLKTAAGLLYQPFISWLITLLLIIVELCCFLCLLKLHFTALSFLSVSFLPQRLQKQRPTMTFSFISSSVISPWPCVTHVGTGGWTGGVFMTIACSEQFAALWKSNHCGVLFPFIRIWLRPQVCGRRNRERICLSFFRSKRQPQRRFCVMNVALKTTPNSRILRRTGHLFQKI